MPRRWYVAYTKPQAEEMVAGLLVRRGVEVFLPRVRRLHRRRGEVLVPFFPCYLFVRLDWEEAGAQTVRWTPGLRRLISFDGERPAPLSDETVEEIRRRLDALNAAGGLVPRYVPGQWVRIVEGPLKGVEGIFQAYTAEDRVRVLLELLGRENGVELPLQAIEAVAGGPSGKRPRRTRGRGRRIRRRGVEEGRG